VVVLLPGGRLVRRVPEDPRDREQALGVSEGAAEPAVGPRPALDRPAGAAAVGAEPPQLAVQMLRLRFLQEPPQVQLGPWSRTRG